MPCAVPDIPDRVVSVACGGGWQRVSAPAAAVRRASTLSSPPLNAGYHTCAVTCTGSVYTWGLGEGGRLGHGTSSNKHSPTLVTALSRLVVVAVAAGGHHTLAITDQGLLFAWCAGACTAHGCLHGSRVLAHMLRAHRGGGSFGKLGHGGADGAALDDAPSSADVSPRPT